MCFSQILGKGKVIQEDREAICAGVEQLMQKTKDIARRNIAAASSSFPETTVLMITEG
jgi:hypothetical protein